MSEHTEIPSIQLDKLDEYDPQILLTYAREELGLPAKDNMRKKTLIKMIMEAHGMKPEPEVTAPAPAPAAGPAADEEDSDDEYNDPGVYNPKLKAGLPPIHANRKVPRIRILVASDKGPGGSDDVIVQVQGVVYQIKRGQEVEVPAFVVEALRNAVEEQYEEREDDSGNKYMVSRRVPSYPFQVLSAG